MSARAARSVKRSGIRPGRERGGGRRSHGALQPRHDQAIRPTRRTGEAGRHGSESPSSPKLRRGKAATPLLPGEQRSGWSVYRVVFADGAAYVGITRLPVAERLAQHLGLENSLDPAAPPLALRRAIRSNGAILRRAQAGVRYRFRVLAAGLDGWQARTFEDAAIRRLKRPLNRTANARWWSDPLADDLAEDPAHGAVARLWRRRARDGDKPERS